MRLDALHRRVIMDASALHNDLRAVLPATVPHIYVNRGVYLRPLMKRIDTISKRFHIHNNMVDDTSVPKAAIKFTAEWRPEELLPYDGSDANIHIHWMTHPRGRCVIMTPETWSMFRFSYWSYVFHELVHRHQDYYRGDRSSPRVYRPISEKAHIREEQRYLGDFDEIEAYAFDVVLEMFARFPTNSWENSFLATQQLIPAATFPSTYAIYLKTFAETPSHPVIATFHRKMRTWFDVMMPHRDFYRNMELSAHGRPLFS